MAVAEGQKTRLGDALAALWPSLPFMAYGLWCAWTSLTYSGSLWLSDSEVDGTYLSQLYIFSTFACGVVFVAAALLARRGLGRAISTNRAVVSGGVLACAGCLIVIIVGPYYLGGLLGDGFNRVMFWISAAATGVGTSLLGLRCGALFGMLAPRRTLIYASLAQLVSAFVYLLAFAFPAWAPIEHGPSLAGIVFFCALPLVAAFLSCIQPSKGTGIDDAALARYATEACASPAASSAPAASAAPSAPTSPGAPAIPGVPAKRRTPYSLPATFWRFAAFTFFTSLFTSLPRASVVTTHALASTVEGSNLIVILRVVMAACIVAYAARGTARGIGFGKACSLLVTFSAVITACAAALGGLANEWSLVVYFAASVFEFLIWCLLAFIVVQKRISPLVVFGFGRGLFMLGCGVGWMLGYAVMPLVPPGTPTTVLFLAMAGIMLLLALGLFSEKDYERLFSPVGEEELSLEDLFDLERREQELAEERRGEKRGRFSRAIEEVARANQLSAREAEVFRCLAMGYGSDRIADIMRVKVNTVRAHTHNVYVKLDVHSREELMRLVDAAVARQQGA